ncbi:zinc finger protein 862-like [Diadema setosum]|uniref:zinc finger protein 862-like n=3 Tax=Diadema antillarum TaxID=105358 RepID=UPI003A84DBEC
MATPPAKKSKTKYEASRKYLTSWETEFNWLTSVMDNDVKLPFCKYCRKQLKPHHASLKKHQDTPSHVAARRAIAGSSMTKFATCSKKIQPADAVKAAELHLAVTTCCHSPLSSIDHLSETIKKYAAGSTLESISIHRTKCTKLVTQVIAPTIKEQVKEDMSEKAFSLIIDESTDVSSTRVLAILARYFSEEKMEILTVLLGFQEICEATGEQLFKALQTVLDEYNLNLSRCVGLATDGASNMTGEHNSVWSRVKEVAPKCTLMKCVCHSIALCVQKAFEGLPSNVGFMLCEVPSFFSHSFLRREAYKSLYDTFCAEELEEGELASKKMPFKKMSTTRWLVRGELIRRIWEHWDPLKNYFQMAMNEGTQDVRYRARMLFHMFDDKSNFLYFTFLAPVVENLDRLNQKFQAENASPEGLSDALDMQHKSLKERVYDHGTGARRPLNLIDYGHKFTAEAVRLQREPAHLQIVDNVRTRCADFLACLISEIEKRLPESKKTFQKLSLLHPKNVLSQMSCCAFSDLPLLHLCEDLDVVEEQYRMIRLHLWKEEKIFKGSIPDDSQSFWKGILNHENSDRHKPYRTIGLYALGALSCPISNASVERIFSIVTWAKNKYRNQLSTKTLEAIVLTKTTFGCCNKFEVTAAMLKRFNASIYD